MTSYPRPADDEERPPVIAAVIPREARPYQGQRAGLVTRLTANTIDFVVIVIVLTLCYLGFCGLRFLWSPSTFHFPSLSSVPILLVGGVVLFLYLTVEWAITGRTYGDYVLGIRVLDRRGERMHLALAALRAVFCVVFPVGILFVPLSPARRSVQDVVLRTQVVYDWSNDSTRSVLRGSSTN